MILLGHGSGGRLSQELIAKHFVQVCGILEDFTPPEIAQLPTAMTALGAGVAS